VKSANRRARGLSPQLILADEPREQTHWEAWQAITAMTLAHPEGLVFALSSAGEHDTSVVLNALQAKGRAQAEGDTGDFFYAESVLVGATETVRRGYEPAESAFTVGRSVPVPLARDETAQRGWARQPSRPQANLAFPAAILMPPRRCDSSKGSE
jgi:hypothetical protein